MTTAAWRAYLGKLVAGAPAAVETVVAMTATVLLIALVDPAPGLLVLGAVLAMTLSRSTLVDTWRGRLESLIVLPMLAIVTAGVAITLAFVPIVGAIAFSAAMFLSVWLRRFGPTWQRIGSLVALPFITLLIAPVSLAAVAAPVSPGASTPVSLGAAPLLSLTSVAAAASLTALVSLTALAVVVLVRVASHAVSRLASRFPFQTFPRNRTSADADSRPVTWERTDEDARPGESAALDGAPDGAAALDAEPDEDAAAAPGVARAAMRPIPGTRMAIQLAAAVAVAFVLGFWLFPEHWGWVVLTAYLVSAGNRGRADVLYKSGLRILGAAAGSIAAVAVTGVHLEGPPLVAVVIGAVAIGLVLRNLSYAFWALIVTLALTVLQGGLGAQPVELWPRVLAILVGAACGVLAAWFILPIRSENVLRRRIADTLAALDAYLAVGSPKDGSPMVGSLAGGSLAGGSLADGSPADGSHTDAPPAPTAERIDEVAKPFEALARVPFAPARWRRAGEWAALTTLAIGLATDGGEHRAARRQLGEARRALREPERLGAALRELVAALR